MNWISKIKHYSEILDKVKITDSNSTPLTPDDGFDVIKKIALTMRKNNKTLYAIGNGASASMASHFSADLAKNGNMHTQVFSDLSLITAISNDVSFEHVFSLPLKNRGEKGDVLAAISSSGNSPNIIKAVETAKKMNIATITLSAMNMDNKLRQSGDINIYVPAQTYGDAESCHAIILHYWIDLIIG